MSMEISKKDINLRQYKKKDFLLLYEIRNDPVVQTLLLTHYKLNSPIMVRSWINKKSKDPFGVFLVIVNSKDYAMGFVQAKNIDFLNRTCTGGVAIHPRYQKKGIFPVAFGLFERCLKETKGIRKIIVEIMKENHPSVKSFSRIGYYQAGLLKEHFYHDNVFSDIIIMEKFI